MKQIGHEVIARMLHDKMKCELLAEKAIPGFDLNTVSFEVVGPVFDNDYGAEFIFKLIDNVDITCSINIWKIQPFE